MEDIDSAKEPLRESDVFELSDDFHKLFLRSGDYFAQIDTNADPHYDASGLGRIHKRGAPSEICLSCPGAASPSFFIDKECACEFSLAPGATIGGELVFKTCGEYRVLSKEVTDTGARSLLSCKIGEREIAFEIDVTPDGVSICAGGEGEVAVMLPALFFDGEERSEVIRGDNMLEVRYRGYICRYSSNAAIYETDGIGCNRNGHYYLFFAKGIGKVKIDILIDKLDITYH